MASRVCGSDVGVYTMRYSAWSEDVDAVLKYYKVHKDEVRTSCEEHAEFEGGAEPGDFRRKLRQKERERVSVCVGGVGDA